MAVFTESCLSLEEPPRESEASSRSLGDRVSSSTFLEQELKLVLDGRDFQVKSTRCRKLRECASSLLFHVRNHKDEAKKFTEQLIETFLPAITPLESDKPVSTKRECVWAKYNELRHAKAFKRTWECFLDAALPADLKADPTLIQHLSQQLLERLIKMATPISVTENASTDGEDAQELTRTEVSALRYAAGYVPRALRKKLEKSSHPKKEEFILCLMDMLEKRDESGDEDSQDTSLAWTSEWTDRIDRGGLYTVNDLTFSMFMAIELCVRRMFNTKTMEERAHGSQQVRSKQVMEAILEDEDVLFHWSMLSVDLEDDDSELLERIVDLWVTMRGFSFTSSWLELYKQSKKKSTYKAKALRTQLQASGK